MLCAWFTSMTSCWRAATLLVENMCLTAFSNLYEWGKCESRVFKQCAHESHKPTTNAPEHGAESHRRRDRKSKITPLELSQLRALNGHLLWLGMQCLRHFLALLSLLMGQTPQATVDTIYKVNKLAPNWGCREQSHVVRKPQVREASPRLMPMPFSRQRVKSSSSADCSFRVEEQATQQVTIPRTPLYIQDIALCV